MIYLDTETCGYHGPIVIMQYAYDYGEPIIHHVWKVPVKETLALVEELVNSDICCFNMVFDWFHVCQTYNILRLCKDHTKAPEVEECYRNQEAALDGPCLKPRGAFDLLLYLRKGEYQSTMNRKNINIRKIPRAISTQLRDELEERVKFRDIYFARRKKKNMPKWRISELIPPDTEFVNLTLQFKASSALKNIISDLFPNEQVTKLQDVNVNPKLQPTEYGYAPTKGNWNRWIKYHINHWSFDEGAIRYATNDVIYLQWLYKHFNEPAINDDDSILATMVGAVRWKGYHIDIPRIRKLIEECKPNVPVKPSTAKVYLTEVMDSLEAAFVTGTDKKILNALARWENDDGTPHPVVERARAIGDARTKLLEKKLYQKLLFAGRFHVSLKIIGTKSERMSGADDLNAQGINRTKRVRSCFNYCPPGSVYQLDGGDFISFEVVIADAVYNDPALHAAILKGQSPHGIFGTYLYPGCTYEDIIATKGTVSDSKYDISKNGVFTMIYGAEAYTLHNKYDIPMDVAETAFLAFQKQFPGIPKARKEIADKFQALAQPNGIGTAINWKTPSNTIRSLFGFERDFTLENRTLKALFDMAQKLPDSLRNIHIKVNRRDRLQTTSGAVQSALYAAAFAIQGANQRAAINHVVQSSGAKITKLVQMAMWAHQPQGIHPWVVQPCNIHDEIMCPVLKDHSTLVAATVKAKVTELRSIVSLLDIGWKTNMTSWAEK